MLERGAMVVRGGARTCCKLALLRSFRHAVVVCTPPLHACRHACASSSPTAGVPVRVLAAQLVKTTHQTHAETMAMLADQIDSLSTTVHEVVLQLETLSDVV